MKDKEPPLADISPGGRALRAAKSKTKHFKSFLQMGIDAATVAGNERKAHHLKEALAQLLNEAHNDVTADPQKVAADLNKSLSNCVGWIETYRSTKFGDRVVGSEFLAKKES